MINGDVAAVQEVAIIPDDGSTWDMHIVKVWKSLIDDLIQVLKGIRDEIDQDT